jgi:hypothetical protein
VNDVDMKLELNDDTRGRFIDELYVEIKDELK